MAASGNEAETLQPDVEEDEAEDMEREIDSGEDDAMAEENSEGEEDEDTSEDERETEAEIQRLEEQLSINAFDYNCHVDLIKLLKHEGKLHRLRKARQTMSELFPLTEEIWLDWLKDEIRLTEGDGGEREKIYELFEKAAKDYICPDVWLEYAQYSIGGMGASGGIERVRSVFERALTAVGLHMTKGAILWEAYREFEAVILSTLQPAPGGVARPEQQDQLNAQLERMHTLFRRQLAVPLMDMESTYAEYSDWADAGVSETVQRHYKQALQQLETRRQLEEALLASEPPKLAEYQSLIDFEMKDGDPARVQISFERALAENCLVPDLWARYTTYLDRQLKIKDVVLSCHERAVRNCPWTMSLWKNYLLALERHGVEHHVISDVFERALNAGFIQATDYVEMWQSYLDYLRRRVDFGKEGSRELEELRAAFTRGLDYLKRDVEERFTDSGDLSCGIMQVWAKIEASHCRNVQKARELWDSIMTKGNAKYANMWLEYYNLERSYGDAAHCRKALHRAVQCTSDYPEHVCEVLLNFERVEGSLGDWDAAVQKTEGRLNRVNEQRAKAAEKEVLFAQQEEERDEQRRKAKADKKVQKKLQKGGRTGDKRKAEDAGQDHWEDETDRKRHKGEGDSGEEHAFARPAPPPRRPEPPGLPRTPREAPETSRAPDDRKDSCSVFVSNLAFDLEDPEGKMKAAFGGCGAVVQVRLVYAKGAFRGYGYVQFEDELAAREALKLDRQEMAGRPMFVSPCVDKSKNPDFKVFKYNTSMEKHKIFISGLPFSCTAEKLEELCKDHGTIRAVRLVTNRSGKPKGLAYVEFESEAQASQAVLKMDRTRLENHTLSVAISNPPTRKAEFKPALGGHVTRQLPGTRGKGRTQVSLLPRSLHRHNAPQPRAENGAADARREGPTPGNKPLSNQDFARMLLNK